MIRWASIFISMILEAMPFILIGALISSLIQVFISEDIVKRFLPKSSFVSVIIAALLGLIIPVCECAIVPIARSLMKKGVPITVAIVFMLSVPLVNPVVIASTFYAFKSINIVLIRVTFGILISIFIGIIMSFITKRYKNIFKESSIYENTCDCGCEVFDYFNRKSKVRLCLEHGSKEFLNILRYYIFGSFLSSIFIVLVKEESLISYSNKGILPILIMMALAFLLSLCSEADAFIARGFLDYFGIPAVSAFLILGPMIDLKNTIILNSYFKKSFTTILVTTIILVVFIFSLIISLLGGII